MLNRSFQNTGTTSILYRGQTQCQTETSHHEPRHIYTLPLWLQWPINERVHLALRCLYNKIVRSESVRDTFADVALPKSITIDEDMQGRYVIRCASQCLFDIEQ